MWSVLKLAARAMVWRTTPEPRLVGVPSLIGWAVVLAALRVALQYVAALPVAELNPYGLNAVVAWLALALAVAALFVRPAGRATALAAMLALSMLLDIVTNAGKLGAPLLAAKGFWPEGQFATIAPIAAFGAEIVWWIGAMTAVLRSVEAAPLPRSFAKAAALSVALIGANALLPHAPVFLPPNFDVRTANWWELWRARRIATLQEASQQAQQKLLQAQIAALAPRSDAAGLYALGVAGWADQDVFTKELDGALAVLGNVLPLRGRAIRLNNRPDAGLPLATPQNFAAAVHAVAGAMDKDRDIFLLLLTSHGDPNGFGLQFPDKTAIDLTPQQLASALNNEGIKNRVVIVSACYAGIFVAPLANDDTIVITAADAKSTSFGCAPERDWTYFGDALFRQSLHPGADFESAFNHARVLIAGWELMDHAPPSNPQGHFGPAVVAKLAPYFATNPRH